MSIVLVHYQEGGSGTFGCLDRERAFDFIARLAGVPHVLGAIALEGAPHLLPDVMTAERVASNNEVVKDLLRRLGPGAEKEREVARIALDALDQVDRLRSLIMRAQGR